MCVAHNESGNESFGQGLLDDGHVFEQRYRGQAAFLRQVALGLSDELGMERCPRPVACASRGLIDEALVSSRPQAFGSPRRTRYCRRRRRRNRSTTSPSRAWKVICFYLSHRLKSPISTICCLIEWRVCRSPIASAQQRTRTPGSVASLALCVVPIRWPVENSLSKRAFDEIAYERKGAA
jgi:hypothetical protein